MAEVPMSLMALHAPLPASVVTDLSSAFTLRTLCPASVMKTSPLPPALAFMPRSMASPLGLERAPAMPTNEVVVPLRVKALTLLLPASVASSTGDCSCPRAKELGVEKRACAAGPSWMPAAVEGGEGPARVATAPCVTCTARRALHPPSARYSLPSRKAMAPATALLNWEEARGPLA